MNSGTGTTYLSVIIPAYNEGKRIGKTLQVVDQYLSNQPYEYEVLVVNDGSKDDTAAVVQAMKPLVKNLQLIDNPKNHGKGWVVKQGMLAAFGEVRLFMDADNSTAIDHIERILPKLKEGYEVVIGSRRIPGSRIAVHQSFAREQIGRVFNLIVRLLGGLPYSDTQAGFKAFTSRAVREIFPKQTIYRFAFDVEILAIAEVIGFKIAEVPITWINDSHSTVHVTSMIQMLFETVRVRLNLWSGLYGARRWF